MVQAARSEGAGGITLRINRNESGYRSGWPERMPHEGLTPEEIAEIQRGDYLTLSGLCQELHFGYDWLWKLARNGYIKAWRPTGGQYRIPLSQVVRMKSEGIKSARQVKQEAREKAGADALAQSKANVLHIPVRLRKPGPKGAVLHPPPPAEPSAGASHAGPPAEPVTTPSTAENPPAPAAAAPAKPEGPRRGYLTYPFAALED